LDETESTKESGPHRLITSTPPQRSSKSVHKFLSFLHTKILWLCGSLAQWALSLKRLSAGPAFNPQTRQNKLFQDYWRAYFEINFSDRQEGLTVSSIICYIVVMVWLWWLSA